jgi:hypothetical protein
MRQDLKLCDRVTRVPTNLLIGIIYLLRAQKECDTIYAVSKATGLAVSDVFYY